LLLLRVKLISRSFADYEEWEKAEISRAEAERQAQTPGTAISKEAPADSDPSQMWIAYPHARREMVRELAFLAAPTLLAYAGWMLFRQIWPPPVLDLPAGMVGFVLNPHWVPLWAQALGGVLLGYLVGGGLVWAVRIAGSAAFGKEAMGMGDVHLLAAVGACLGWIDAVLTFFAAAFVGVAWAAVGAIGGGRVRRAMPYGPFLAIATLLVLVLKPLIEKGLNGLVGVPPGAVPINIP
jgi:leader peptidase (prepilin peptidase)/N-methyltransferase